MLFIQIGSLVLSILEKHIDKSFDIFSGPECLPQTAKATSSHEAAQRMPVGVVSAARPPCAVGPAKASDAVFLHLALGTPTSFYRTCCRLLLHKARPQGNLFPSVCVTPWCFGLLTCHSFMRQVFVYAPAVAWKPCKVLG